jgi:hypothetical protein
MWICARCTHSNAADNFRCGGNSLAGCGSVNPHLHPGGAPSLEPAGSFNAVPQFQILDGSPNTNGGSGSSSIDNSSDSRRNANGWDCPKCGNHNFAARTVCNMRHCKMVRLSLRVFHDPPPPYFSQVRLSTAICIECSAAMASFFLLVYCIKSFAFFLLSLAAARCGGRCSCTPGIVAVHRLRQHKLADAHYM